MSPENITFELKHDAEIIGYSLKIDTLKVEKIMRDMVDLGLFECSGATITCLKMARRLDNTMSQSPEIKETLSNFKKLEADKIRREEKRIDNKKTKAAFAAVAVEIPFAVDQQNWIRWCEYRTSKRKPISEMAAKEQLALLSLYPIETQIAIVGQSIANDWQGLFEPKTVKQQTGTRATSLIDDLTDRSWAS